MLVPKRNGTKRLERVDGEDRQEDACVVDIAEETIRAAIVTMDENITMSRVARSTARKILDVFVPEPCAEAIK
jgi:hypothetical protein